MFDSLWDDYKIVLYWDCPHSYRHLVHQKIMILFVFGMHEYRYTLYDCANMDCIKEGEKGLIAAPRFSSYWMWTHQKHYVFFILDVRSLKHLVFSWYLMSIHWKALRFLYMWCKFMNKPCVFFIFDVKSWKHVVFSLYVMSNILQAHVLQT